jgi:hypothetical protein
MCSMHAAHIKDAALELAAQGVNDCEIARRLGVPRSTVRDWRRPARPRAREIEHCWRCWRVTTPVRFTAPDYAELLGLYLGDGHISRFARTERLRLHLDARYPTVVDDAEALLRRSFPDNRTGRYEYLSYEFSNLSREIVDLFIATCERVGLQPRRYPRYVRLYRRVDVARLLVEVGTKS